MANPLPLQRWVTQYRKMDSYFPKCPECSYGKIQTIYNWTILCPKCEIKAEVMQTMRGLCRLMFSEKKIFREIRRNRNDYLIALGGYEWQLRRLGEMMESRGELTQRWAFERDRLEYALDKVEMRLIRLDPNVDFVQEPEVVSMIVLSERHGGSLRKRMVNRFKMIVLGKGGRWTGWAV